jgi:hypothetical protein
MFPASSVKPERSGGVHVEALLLRLAHDGVDARTIAASRHRILHLVDEVTHVLLLRRGPARAVSHDLAAVSI